MVDNNTTPTERNENQGTAESKQRHTVTSRTEARVPLRSIGLTLLVGVILLAGLAAFFGTAAAAQSAPDCSTVSYSQNSSGFYEVTNVNQLQCLGDSTNTSTSMSDDFVLTQNIDASDTSSWNGGKGFAPISPTYSSSFKGTFDGNGHTISNLTIDRPGGYAIGVFGRFGVNGNPASIRNIGLSNVSITGGWRVGGLIGINRYGSTVSQSYTTGEVTSTDSQSAQSGGLVGYNRKATVEHSYSTATVIGQGDRLGGLVGYSRGSEAEITNSYAAGNVTNDNNLAIEIGGLVGEKEGTVSGSYWDMDATGQSDGIGKGSGGVTGLATTEMTGTGAQTNMSGLDFSTTWDTNPVNTANGYVFPYPTLTANTQSPAPSQTLYAGGDGTEGNEYEIANWYHLNNTRENLGDNFKLVNELNSSTTGYSSVASSSANGGDGFVPIGEAGNSFNGTFDGNGHTISDLYINRTSEAQVGLFGIVSGSDVVINDTRLESVDITGDAYVGGLSGRFRDAGGPVNNVSVTGTVSGSEDVGGLAGEIDSIEVNNSHANVTVTGTKARIGGLIGKIDGGTVTNSSTTGTVSNGFADDADAIGGLVGKSIGGLVSSSYSNVTVDDPQGFLVGGLVGVNEGGTINTSYATGDVTGDSNVGGLVGAAAIDGTSIINTSYAAGSVSGKTTVGGYIGYSRDTVNGYWDIQTTGQSSYAGSEFQATNDTAGLTSTEMTGTRASTNMEDLDFTATWQTTPDTSSNGAVVSYPVLTTNTQSPPPRTTLYADGDGTTGNEYEIANWYHLDNVREHLDDEFELTADLGPNTAGYDAVANGSANGGDGFVPIGDSSTSFSGTFNGSGHTISDLNIDRPTETVLGLFGVNTGTVNDTALESATVTGTGTVGGLVGKNSGTVAESYVTGNVSGSGTFVGGLVGRNKDTVTDSHAFVNVSNASGDIVGGLVGKNDGTVKTSYATGNVSGRSIIGGLVGRNSDTITNSYATGNVSGSGDYVGGLVGQSDGGSSFLSVTGSYATGNVSGSSNVGGLAGEVSSVTVNSSYASGTVTIVEDSTDPANIGGLVGQNSNGTVEQSNATGDVNAGNATNVGGLIGYSQAETSSGDGGRTVRETYAVGSVTGDENVGGLIGTNVDDTVVDSYSVGAVSGTTNVGGLVGNNTGSEAEVKRSYTAGSVSGVTNSGLVGTNENSATVVNSYWDTETTGQSSSAGGTGLTTRELEGDPAKTNTSLDFTSTWSVVDNSTYISYPYLQDNTQQPEPGLADFVPPTISNVNLSASSGDVNVTLDSDEQLGTSASNLTVTVDGPNGKTYTFDRTEFSESGAGPYTYTLTTTQAYDDGSGTYGTNVTVAKDAYGNNGGTTGDGSGLTDTITLDLTPPSISNVSLSASSGEMDVTFDSNETLGGDTGDLNVTVDGPNGATYTFDRTDFAESGAGPYTYTLTTTQAYDDGSGTYGTNVTVAKDAYGNNGGTTGDGIKLTDSYDVNEFAGGDGTAASPYRIENWTHLNQTRNNLDSEFVMINDLNESTDGFDSVASATANGGSGFIPIGNSGGTPFEGSFDGNGYAIADLTIDRSSESYVGLFGILSSDGVVRNTGIEDAAVTGNQFVGGLVGRNNGTVTTSYATGAVTGSVSGGLVGANGNNGGTSDATVNRSYAISNVSGNQYVGGLVGANSNAAVNSSYAAGNVTGSSSTGGLVGFASGSTETDSYWDVNATGQSNTAGGGEGLTTSEMKGDAARSNMSAFDFADTWDVDTGEKGSYPYLSLGANAPVITALNVTNPSDQNVSVSLETSGQLQSLSVNVTGAESATLSLSNFTESGTGPYTYTATYEGSADGSYTATVESAVGPNGKDGADGESATVSIDTGVDTSPAPSPSPSPSPSPDPANFDVSLNTPTTVTAGDEISIDVTIDNTGDQSDQQTISVSVDGSQHDTRSVSLGGGASESLTVAYPTNATDVGDLDISVTSDNDGETATVTVTDATPTADAGTDRTVATNTTVRFDGANSTDNLGITSYEWDFGDGTTATGATPTHSFLEPGNYTVELTVTDQRNNTDTDTTTVIVTDAADTADRSLAIQSASDPVVLPVTGSRTTTVTVSNNATTTWNLTDITVTGPDADIFSVVSPEAPATVAGGQTRSLTVRVADDTLGNRTATLTVSTDHPAQPTLATSLTFAGPSFAQAEVNTSSLSFGEQAVNETTTRQFTITNPSRSKKRLGIESRSITGQNADEFTTSIGTQTLRPGEQTSVDVTLSPDSPGSKSAILKVVTNSSVDPQIDVWLSNSQTIIIVERVSDGNTTQTDTDTPAGNATDGESESTVQVTGKNIPDETRISVNVSQPETRRSEAALDVVATTLERGGDFSMNISHRQQPTAGVPDFEATSDNESLRYVDVTHSFSNADVSNSSFLVRVSKTRIQQQGVDPGTVMMNRYHDGEWQRLSASMVGETRTHRIYRVGTPGFSTFAVTAPVPELSLDRVSLNRSAIRPGEAVTVTATVRNNGTAEGTMTVPLIRNGTTVATKNVTVGAGSVETVSFVTRPNTIGNQTLIVGSTMAGTVSVQADTGPGDDTNETTPVATATATPGTTDPTGETEPGDGGDGSTIPVVIVLVILIGGAVTAWWVRQRKKGK